MRSIAVLIVNALRVERLIDFVPEQRHRHAWRRAAAARERRDDQLAMTIL